MDEFEKFINDTWAPVKAVENQCYNMLDERFEAQARIDRLKVRIKIREIERDT